MKQVLTIILSAVAFVAVAFAFPKKAEMKKRSKVVKAIYVASKTR